MLSPHLPLSRQFPVPNEIDDGVSTGAVSVPLPCSLIDTGLFLALLVKVRFPVRALCTVGVKVVVTLQLLFGGSTLVHPSFGDCIVARHHDVVDRHPDRFGIAHRGSLSPNW